MNREKADASTEIEEARHQPRADQTSKSLAKGVLAPNSTADARASGIQVA
jgi:hypothetical protein